MRTAGEASVMIGGWHAACPEPASASTPGGGAEASTLAVRDEGDADAGTPETLAGLKAQALERDQGCVWPDDWHDGPLELAHLEHRGMGGRRSVNTLDGVLILCQRHHGILDGRVMAGRRRAVCALLRTWRGAR